MKKSKRPMTLLEIMIVIVIIGIIGSVVGYNMRGSLDRAKAFKTKEGIRQIYDTLTLAVAEGADSTTGTVVAADPLQYLKNAGYIRNPASLLKDGWGIPYKIEFVSHEVRVTSNKYETYCGNKGQNTDYPWIEN